MSRLELRQIVHERGTNGELLPIDVELEVLREYKIVEEKGKKKRVIKTPGPMVKVTPMTRGEIKAMMAGVKKSKEEGKGFETTEDQDGDIIKAHLIDPKVPDDQIKDLKSKYSGAIATAIVAISIEVDQQTLHEAGKAALKEYAEELDKNLKKK